MAAKGFEHDSPSYQRFPVLTLKIVKAIVENRRVKSNAVFKAEDAVQLGPGVKILSPKWCYISI